MLTDYIPSKTMTTTHDAYEGVPLATHSSSARGDILERVAMRVMEEKMGETAHPPPPGTRVNGTKRGRNSEAYDFTFKERRVEVKSAQLKWDSGKCRWEAQWKNIKRDAYDDLLLVLYTPFGVHIFVHDHAYGVTTTGKLQGVNGGYVVVYAPRNVASIVEAVDVVLGKLSHMHHAPVPFTDIIVTTTTTHDAYEGVPLATHSSSIRGNILERVAMRVMEEKMGETAHPPPPGTRVNGTKRGRNSEAYDFMIAGRRVEVKSAQLKWDSSTRRWEAQWKNIKRDAYDDLLLVLYTPFGVHIFVHDHVYGVTTTGKLQGVDGGKVVVRAPMNTTSVSGALDVVLGKLSHTHYATLTYS